MPHCHGVGGGGNRSDTLQRTRAERRCDRGETRYKSSGRAVELGARVNESSIATSSTGFTDALTRSGGQIEAPANTTAALNAAFQKVFEPQVKWRNEKEAAAREAAGGASGFSLFFVWFGCRRFFFFSSRSSFLIPGCHVGLLSTNDVVSRHKLVLVLALEHRSLLPWKPPALSLSLSLYLHRWIFLSTNSAFGLDLGRRRSRQPKLGSAWVGLSRPALLVLFIVLDL